MRYAVYLLVAANLAVFAWWYGQRELYEPGIEPVPAPVYLGAEPLVLLKERAPSQESAATHADGLQDAGAAAVVAVEPAMPVEPASVARAPAQEPPAEPEPAAEPTTVEEPAVAVEPPPPVPPPEPERVCQTIGPFPGQKEVARFLERIKPLPVNPTLRAAKTEQISDYWVFLPEQPRAEARATVRELTARGVKDLFLGKQNYISLGVFSEKRMAEARAKEIGEMGYEPRVEPRFRTRDIFWVDVEETGPELVDADRWQELLKSSGDVGRQPATCE